MRASLFTTLLLALLLGACGNGGTVVDTGGAGGDKVPAGQLALVEHEYVNHAWGYQLRGIVVTGDGEVVGYEWTRGERPWEESESGLESAARLEEKYAHGRTSLGTVGADTLELIRRLIPAADGGELTERQSRGADMGQTTRSAWRLEAGGYRRITLASDGDFEWHNTSAAARQLTAILDVLAERRR